MNCFLCKNEYTEETGHNCGFLYVPPKIDPKESLGTIDMTDATFELKDGTIISYKDWFNATQRPENMKAVILNDKCFDAFKEKK